jgi:hypothetical protein
VFLYGQQPPAGLAGNGFIEGQVISGLTGEPLKKAQVGLRLVTGGESASTVSDAAGHFAIAGVGPGKYNLYAERNGFVRQEYGARGREAGHYSGDAAASVLKASSYDWSLRVIRAA